MKKSTLITTIAMIVVVVVALSTATYAWFSSAADARATTTFTTQAGSDLVITLGTKGAETAASSGLYSYTFTEAAATTLAFPSGVGALTDNLYSPTGTISGTLKNTSLSAVGAVVGQASFYNGQKTGEGTASVSTAPAAKDPLVLKITNTTDAAATTKDLQITVYVKVGDVTKKVNAAFAASALSFVIDYAKVPTGEEPPAATVNTIRTNYNFGAYATNAATHSASDKEDAQTFTSRPTYSTAGTEVVKNSPATPFYKVATNDDPITGYKTGDVYVKYTATITDFSGGADAIFAIYAWIDGWTAEEGAGQATLDTIISFKAIDHNA